MTKIVTDTIPVRSNGRTDIIDITSEAADHLSRADLQNGIITFFISGSTAAITTIEYEPGVVLDLKRAINSLAPPGIEYEHEKAWHDGNGHSHVQAALLGPSIALPIRNGNLKIGTWQQVVAINHDNHPRERAIEVTIIGTKVKG